MLQSITNFYSHFVWPKFAKNWVREHPKLVFIYLLYMAFSWYGIIKFFRASRKEALATYPYRVGDSECIAHREMNCVTCGMAEAFDISVADVEAGSTHYMR